ncbi:sensor histidine kinase [Clostridium sp. DL1XJH146]
MSLEHETEVNQEANLRFANMLKNSVDMLNDTSVVNDEEMMVYLCDSIYRGMENHKAIYVVSDEEKNIYTSRLFDIKESDVSEYGSSDEWYTEYFESGDKHYMQITNPIESAGKTLYVLTVSDISSVYIERVELLSRYRIIVVTVFILLALGMYILTRSFEKNIRISEEMKQIEVASKRQEEFSASFAHECKTPLTSIIGYSDILRTMDLSEDEQKESIEYIFEQGKRLERLTKQMMMLSNLSEGEIANNNVEVTVLIDNVLKVENEQMKKKNIEFTVSTEKGTILGESDLYQSMLTNILDNARKACEENGKIEFTGKSKGNYYEITVVDNGCGMNGETIKKMTEPFYMADKARTRREGGAGLGMAIVGKIAKIFGVEVEVQSVLGEGTTIALLIPKSREV